MKQKQTLKRFHIQRLGLFFMLLFALYVVRSDAHALPQLQTSSTAPQVLAYASEMSRGGLLSGTNTARGANGLGGLILNSQLNSSAQAKADHMAANDYWAHVAPDGTQPWYFFQQAGYQYIRAGENLAYGFMTSQATIDGWMNSASHRANILGDYADVGFGITNVASYQGSGPQTIVVAHYGSTASSQTPAPVTPAAPVAPKASAPPTAPSTPAPVTPTAPVETPVAIPQNAGPVAEKTKETPQATKTDPATGRAEVSTPSESTVSVIGMLARKSLPAAALVSITIVFMTVAGYALTHRAAFHHAVSTGEQYVFTHPGVDAGIVAAITAMILFTSYGRIG